MEHTRCTRCRNPIRARQRRVQDPSGGDSWYHDDCWAAVCADAQHDYAARIRDEGPLALLSPYVVRLGVGSPLREMCERRAGYEQPTAEPVQVATT